MTSWAAGVIAAGQGERLRAGGWRGSKAMLPVAGRPLIDHTLDRLDQAGVGRVVVLINEAAGDARDHLRARTAPIVQLVVRTTPSSFASFALVAGLLGDGPAVVSTVDSIMPRQAFAAFLDAAAARPDALTLGVTRHVDDEKPLWATCAADGRVTALGGERGTHVTAGVYAWSAPLPPVGQGFARLRDYLGALVAAGHPVFGADLPDVLDVDRPADVAAATAALRAWAGVRECAA